MAAPICGMCRDLLGPVALGRFVLYTSSEHQIVEF